MPISDLSIFSGVLLVLHAQPWRGVRRPKAREPPVDTESEEGAQTKIVDFGFVRLKPELDSGMLTPCFTLKYAAPEILEVAARTSQEGYRESCDLWSIGVILVSSLLN